MTLPTLYPTGYDGTDKDFLKCPIDRSGADRTTPFSVTIPDATTTGVIAGVIPFRAGARFSYGGSQFATEDLDTTTVATVDIGYVYNDADTVSNISDPDAFASGLSVSAAGLLTLDEPVGLEFQATADGWIVITTGGATTTTAGDIYGQVCMFYNTNLA